MALFEHEAAGEQTELQRLRRAAENSTEPPEFIIQSNKLTAASHLLVTGTAVLFTELNL